MKQSIKKRFQKLIIILLLGFIALFVYRLIYAKTAVIENTYHIIENYEQQDIISVRKNYATKKYEAANVHSENAPMKINQKYEKIANVNSLSNRFDEEEKLILKQIQNFDALIQYEQKSGNEGFRKLELQIGVPPKNFDKMYNHLIKIGKVQSKQIIKKDKTNEYLELNAKKASLEKIRNSLIDLKLKGGKIEEHILLENRILDIEQQLQNLGVSLGNFDSENEFCTVQFSLTEQKITKISFSERIMSALEWTIITYLKLMASLFFMTLFAYLSLLGFEKLKEILKSNNRK